MTSEVTVTVSGRVGSGKSAICGEIEIALRALGVPVTWDDKGEKNMTHADWQDYLDMYKPNVVIREAMEPKPMSKDQQTLVTEARLQIMLAIIAVCGLFLLEAWWLS